MTTADIDELIEGWTQGERKEIHDALVKFSVGAVKLDGEKNTWCVPLVGTIPAKSTQAVVGRGYVQMTNSKLVILEPLFEKIEHETVIETTAAKIEKTWWRTCIIEPQVTTTRTIEHKRVVIVPRAIWRVRAMFFGNTVAYPVYHDISGDLFGPEGTFTAAPDVLPGLDVTVQVENTTDQAMPFYAVVLGKMPLSVLQSTHTTEITT